MWILCFNPKWCIAAAPFTRASVSQLWDKFLGTWMMLSTEYTHPLYSTYSIYFRASFHWKSCYLILRAFKPLFRSNKCFVHVTELVTELFNSSVIGVWSVDPIENFVVVALFRLNFNWSNPLLVKSPHPHKNSIFLCNHLVKQKLIKENQNQLSDE